MASRLRGAAKRLLVGVSAAGFLIPTVAFSGISVARAGVDCGVGVQPWYEVSVSRKDVIWTHTIAYATVLPYGSATRTISRSTTLTGSIQINVGFQADASAIIAKASAKVGVTLKGEGSATDGSSMSITANNNTGRYHDYVFFSGTRTAKGTWARYYCSADEVKTSSSGTWFSWNAQYFGGIRCDNDSAIATKYGQWSVQYEAVSSCA